MDEIKEIRERNKLYDCLNSLIKAVIVLLLCFGFFYLGAYTAGAGTNSKSSKAPFLTDVSDPADFIIGPCELQERLNRIEPDNPIRVDGIIGPESIAKWNRVFFNQSAMKTFKKTPAACP